MCAVFEATAYIFEHYITASHPFLHALASSRAQVRCTPFFILGVLAVVFGAHIRLDCFKTLGDMFTFDLTILPAHKLVTTRFYGWVRHPSYTGSMLLIIGLSLSHLTPGSWLRECVLPWPAYSAAVLWVLWWGWTWSVGVSRAKAEDLQMRKLFKEEWEEYAENVPYWFFPGVY